MTSDERGIAQLSEILVSDKPLGGTAQDVVDLARTSLNQCDGVGVQLLDHDGVGARAFTDARSFELDALQTELDDGPCVMCLRDGERHDLEPVTSDERWPSFAPSARRAGLIACLALPLIAYGELIGALNLYAWPVVGFAGWDRQHCTTFARHASISLASAQAYARTQVIITELRGRLAAPDDIVHQAHGVLMALEHATLGEAVVQLSDLAELQGNTIDGAAQSVLDSISAS